jgi:plasmid stabilization system protein ParE
MTLKPIRLRPEAELEIEEAFDYYLRESPRIAGRFLDEIASSLKKIQRDPQLYPAYTKNTRRGVLAVFRSPSFIREGRDHPDRRHRSRKTPRGLLDQAPEAVS